MEEIEANKKEKTKLMEQINEIAEVNNKLVDTTNNLVTLVKYQDSYIDYMNYGMMGMTVLALTYLIVS